MIHLEITFEELRAIILAIETESFCAGFGFKRRVLLLKLQELEKEYFKEKTPPKRGKSINKLKHF